MDLLLRTSVPYVTHNDASMTANSIYDDKSLSDEERMKLRNEQQESVRNKLLWSGLFVAAAFAIPIHLINFRRTLIKRIELGYAGNAPACLRITVPGPFSGSMNFTEKIGSFFTHAHVNDFASK